MRAIVVRRTGGPEVLEAAEVPDPQPGPGQLLVDVAAAGVNFMDIYQREGRPPYSPGLPYVPGAEGAGTVLTAGLDVTGFAAGDRVAWTGVPGSYASRAVVPAASALPVPDGVGLETAAAVLLQGMTAHYLSHDTFPVGNGDTVVVHAAAGGVGLLLTQMVTMRGRADDLFSWIARGRLSVRIGGSYPLAEAGRAHQDLASRGTTGKLILLP